MNRAKINTEELTERSGVQLTDKSAQGGAFGLAGEQDAPIVNDGPEQAALGALRAHSPKRYEAYERCVLKKEPQGSVAADLGVSQAAISWRVRSAKQFLEMHKPVSARSNAETLPTCSGCRKELPYGNTSGQCQSCAAKRVARTPPQETFNGAWEGSRQRGRDLVHALAHGDKGPPEAAAVPVLAWLDENNLGISEGAALLKCDDLTLRTFVCPWMGRPISQRQAEAMACRLGRIRACGWDEDQWKRELLPHARENPAKGVAATWVETFIKPLYRLYPEFEGDEFVATLRDSILRLAAIYEKQARCLTAREVGVIAGIPSGKISTWLYLAYRPRLHHVPGIARLVLLSWDKEFSDSQWDEQINHLCSILWKRTLAIPGLIVVKAMWRKNKELGGEEREKTTRTRWSQRRLEDEVYEGHRANRLLFDGIARRRIAIRVADALEIAGDEREKFLSSVRGQSVGPKGKEAKRKNALSARNAKKRKKETEEAAERRNANLPLGTPAATKKRTRDADDRARKLCQRHLAKTGRLPTQTWLEKGQGVSRTVAKRALASFAT